MSDRGDRLRVGFPDQGYLLVCDERGVEIHVTDYHAGTLSLSWEMLAGWRNKSTSAQRELPLDGRPGSGHHGRPGRKRRG